MFKELKLMMYNKTEHKFRGSFITLCSTALLYFAFIIIIGLIINAVLNGESLASLTTLILGIFGTMSTSITVIFGVWKTKKSKLIATEKVRVFSDK